jgi:hypothetical protein
MIFLLQGVLSHFPRPSITCMFARHDPAHQAPTLPSYSRYLTTSLPPSSLWNCPARIKDLQNFCCIAKMAAVTSVNHQSQNSSSMSFPSFRSQIIGTWDLVSYVGININNPEDIIYPLGKEAKGQIMYTNDGYMSALLQQGNLKPFEHDWKHGTIEELASAAKNTMAYGGPYYVEERPGNPQQIVHHVQISMHPNLTNTLQIRCAELFEESGRDYLMLGPQTATEWDGVVRLLRLKWQKRSQNDVPRPPPEAKELKL